MKVCFALWIALFLFGGASVRGQENAANIKGIVQDSTGAVVPGATISITNDDTGITRTAETDQQGRYFVASLGLGNYRVTAAHEGFQTAVRSGIVLTVGREAVVDITLALGSTSQQVEVKAEAPLVESTSASIGSLVTGNTIRNLPLNGRSYDQLALLQPGVTLTAPGPTGNSVYVFGSGKRFSVGGQRPASNVFLLDGTDINDQGNGTPGGAAGTNLGVDTILEFKIFTNDYKAEYGHSNGAIITAVTRSGTNALHGTGFEYLRNSAFDARNFFDTGSSPPSFKRNQFGGVIGGPIKKDKTFFFGGYEGLRQGLGTSQVATVPTLLARQGILPTGTVQVSPIIQPYLSIYPAPNGRDFGDGTAQYLSAPQIVTNEDNVMIRVDHQLDSKTSLFARYTFDKDNVNAPYSLPAFVQVAKSKRQYSTLQATSILTPKALNNVRFAFNRSDTGFDQLLTPADPEPNLSFVPGQTIGQFLIGGNGAIATSNLTALGQADGPALWAYNVFELGDDVSYVTGKHSLRAGVDIQRLRDNTSIASNLRGAYTFSTLANLLTGTSSNLQVAYPIGVTPDWGLRQTLFSVYAQDDFAVSSRITLNLGLRWEAPTDPVNDHGEMSMLPSLTATSTVISDRYFTIAKNNYEPRLGMAWKLDGSGKTVLRLGAGIYHNQILPWLYAFQVANPPFFGRYNLNNPTFPNQYQTLTGNPAGLIALKMQAPFDKTPVNDQYTLSIQRQLSSSIVLQVAYAGNKSNHLQTVSEQDTAVPTFLPDGNVFYAAGAPRKNTGWSGIRYYETNGNSIYNAVTVTLRRQLVKGFEGQVFYTFSKATDDATNASAADSVRAPNTIMDPYDRNRDWGLAEIDVRNAFNATFSYLLPFRVEQKAMGAIVNGWTLNGIATLSPGLPFTARLTTSRSRDLAGTLSERPDLKPGANQNPTSGVTAGCTGIAAGQQLGTANLYYDPCAFALPPAGMYGNLGRDTLIGPGLEDVDLSIQRSFRINERANAMFRFEVFNLLNHTNLGLPAVNALTATGAPNPQAGVITYTTTSSRQIQLALRITF